MPQRMGSTQLRLKHTSCRKEASRSGLPGIPSRSALRLNSFVSISATIASPCTVQNHDVGGLPLDS